MIVHVQAYIVCVFRYDHASITTSARMYEWHEWEPGKAAAVQIAEPSQRRDRVDRAGEAVAVQLPVQRRLSGTCR